ncbi:MAG: hypothetical protein JO002_09020 [Burkholderiaceae bacterium]|nr:hypothetical protein [Burkholderiaceae bacterium]
MMKSLLAVACMILTTFAIAGTKTSTGVSSAKPDLVFKTSTNIQCNAGASGPCQSQTTTFECNNTPMGQCYFLVMSTKCDNEGAAANGDEVCVIRSLGRFTLKPGESKTLPDLPPDFTHCAENSQISGLRACLAKQIRH